MLLGAQHAVVVGCTRQRCPDLAPVDEPAAVDLFRRRAEGRTAGGGRSAFAERLGIDGAVFHHAGKVQLAPLQVFGAFGVGHGNAVCQHAGPQRGADVHVPGQRGRAAKAADLGCHHGIGGVVGAQAAMGLRHAQAQKAGLAQFVVVGKRKAGRLVPVGCACSKTVLAELVGLGQQLALQGGEAGAADGRRETQAVAGGAGWGGRHDVPVAVILWRRPATAARRARRRHVYGRAMDLAARWTRARRRSAPSRCRWPAARRPPGHTHP